MKNEQTKEQATARFCRLLLIMMLIVCVSVAVFLGFRRNIYHIDEVWSYALGNSTMGKYWFQWWDNGDIQGDALPDATTFFEHWKDGSYFRNYVTVQPGEEFRYDIPYHYQETDVSPPLYYIMLHTICSFFPDQFSRWYGLIPNILFYIICIPVLYLIAVKIFKTRIQAIIATAFWALSRAAFSDVNLIRMYMLSTMIVILSFALHLQLLEEREKPPYQVLIPMFFVNITGFLTQNYLYVFTFLMAVMIVILMIYRRQIKLMIVFSLTELLSVGAAFLIFPAAIAQMTKSNYAKDSINHMKYGVSLNQHGFFDVLLKNTFGIADNVSSIIELILYCILWFLLIALVLFLLFIFLDHKKVIHFDEKSLKMIAKIKEFILESFLKRCKEALHSVPAQRVIFLFFTAVLTGKMIEVASPEMGIFQDRYFFLILPLSFLAVIWLCFAGIEKLSKHFSWNSTILTLAQTAVLVLGIAGNFWGKNHYMFYEKNQQDLEKMFSGQTCIVANEPNFSAYLVHNHAAWFQNADKVYFTRCWNEQTLGAVNETDSCYLLINEAIRESEKIMEEVSALHQVEYVGFYFMNESSYDIYYLS